MGQGFQFTPDGIEPIVHGVDRLQVGGAINPAAPPSRQLVESTPVAQQVLPALELTVTAEQPKPKRATQSEPVITGNRQLIRAAKARLRELKAELKRLKAVEREKAELERLLKAARQKPASTVRSLRSA